MAVYMYITMSLPKTPPGTNITIMCLTRTDNQAVPHSIEQLHNVTLTQNDQKDFQVYHNRCKKNLKEHHNERNCHVVYTPPKIIRSQENCTHDRLLSLNYAFCHMKRLLKTSEPVYRD